MCTALMLIRYHNVFETAFQEFYMEDDFYVVNPMHFMTVGMATTRSSSAKRCLNLNKGTNCERSGSSFCWSTIFPVLASSIALQGPLYVYNSFLRLRM
jgi:hypothetical protein